MFTFNKEFWKIEYNPENYINEHLTFTDKFSYLEWVKSWKEQYKELTVRTRFLKKEKPVNWQSERSYNRGKARAMLAIRLAGKSKSWEMKQLSRVLTNSEA